MATDAQTLLEGPPPGQSGQALGQPRIEVVTGGDQGHGAPLPERSAGSLALWFLAAFALVLLPATVWNLSRPPVYRATATVLTTVPAERSGAGRSDADVQHVAIQRQLLLGRQLLADTIARVDAAGGDPPPTPDDLRPLLTVDAVPGTNLVELSAEGGLPLLLSDIVNAWLASYEGLRQAEIEARLGTRLEKLAEQGDSLETQIAAKRAALTAFREQRDIVTLERDSNRALNRLNTLQASLAEAEDAQIKARARLMALESAAASGAPVIVDEAAATLAQLQQQEAELAVRVQELQKRYTEMFIQNDPDTKKRREAAQQIAGLEAGDFGAQDVAKLSPESSFKLGDASDAFDEKKQEEAMRQLWTWFDRVAAGDVVPPEVKPMLLEAGGAMAVQGILSPTVAGLREQAQISPMLKNKIRTLGDQLGPQLLGKKTRVTKEMDPELFDQLTRSFPAVVNGSKAFKDGRGEVAELLIDAEGVDKVQDAKVYAVLEGINPQTGERYRAPMTAKRSGDPDDELSPMRVGGLYAQAEFAEKASRAILAALAGEDDATSEKILQDHWRRAEEYKKEMAARRKNAGVAGVLGNIVGLKADEQKKLIGAVEAGADAKGSVEMILKARPQAKEVDLEWRDNVNVGG